MAKPKVRVTVEDMRGMAEERQAFHVIRVENSTEPKIGDLISVSRVQSMITEGVTVIVVPRKR